MGSWCNSLCKIPQRFPSRADLCDNLINFASPPPFYQHLCDAVASLPATVGSDGEALTPQTLSGLMANPVKLQNCPSSDIAEENAASAGTFMFSWQLRNCLEYVGMNIMKYAIY